MKTGPIEARFVHNPCWSVDAVALIERKRRRNRTRSLKSPRQYSPVLYRHCGALSEIRKGRMGGVAQEGRRSSAPVLDSRPAEEGPSIALLPIDSIDDRLNVGVPALQILLEPRPRQFGRPRLFTHVVCLDDAHKIEQGSRANVVGHDV